MVLYMGHDEVVTFDSMKSTILGHLVANVKHYKLFHTVDVIKDAERYFKFGQCTQYYCCLYQKGQKGNKQILKHTNHTTGKEVHFKFTCDPSNVADNHYEAILLLNKPTERNTEEVVMIESPCPSTFEQPISLDDAHDVTDLTDDSELTPFQK